VAAPPVGTAPGAEAWEATGNPANGKCLSFSGYLPARTLGISPVDNNGFALDGWGTPDNRIRYAVSNDKVGTVDRAFMTTDGIRIATLAAVAGAPPLLNVCDSGTGINAADCGVTSRTLTSNAVAVIWSVGANASTGGVGNDEKQNPNPKNETSTNRTFVSHTATDITNNAFDDIVTWVSINTLVNRLVGAGQLP
jgi:hypothetical protein